MNTTIVKAYKYYAYKYYNAFKTSTTSTTSTTKTINEYTEWIQSQGGQFEYIHNNQTLINFAKDSDAVMFVLKWGIK